MFAFCSSHLPVIWGTFIIEWKFPWIKAFDEHFLDPFMF